MKTRTAIMLWLIICCATLLTAKCEGIIEAKCLVTFTKQFRAPQPLPIFYNVPKQTRIKFIKLMSNKGFKLEWIDKPKYTEKFLLDIIENDEYLGGDEKINIDQQIYFLTQSLDLYEKYTINNELVRQKLGHFVDGIYIPEEFIEENFWKRRGNFHGSELIALVGEYGTYLEIENLTNAPYFPSNETYDVTGLIQGSFFYIWTTLQNNLNFSTKSYSRKDQKWGVPSQHPNGSISVPDGAIKDIMDGVADIIPIPITLLYNRYLVIDYLVPLVSEPNGIFIKTGSIQESLDFEVFRKPFDKWTWTALVSSSLLITISIVLTSKVLNHGKLNYLTFIDILAKSLIANLGNASFTPINNKFHSLQMAIFVALMTGNIIWIAYNGALLSKLVEPSFDKPFHDLESLAKSNYR